MMKLVNIALLFSLLLISAKALTQELPDNPESGDEQEEQPLPSPSTPASGKQPSSGESKSPQDQASESAAKEVGRVIGRKIGEDALRQMSQPDRKALLERTRAAIRGEILRRYVFSESPYMNSFVGSMMVLREGFNHAGFECKELEIDLVYKVERIYEKATLCKTSTGEWSEYDVRDVDFPRRGEPTPGSGSGRGPRGPGAGGWLPPL
jgi:hypothetical protein